MSHVPTVEYIILLTLASKSICLIVHSKLEHFGHTKFAPDLYFGLYKKSFRNSDSSNSDNIVSVAAKACQVSDTITAVSVGMETGEVQQIVDHLLRNFPPFVHNPFYREFSQATQMFQQPFHQNQPVQRQQVIPQPVQPQRVQQVQPQRVQPVQPLQDKKETDSSRHRISRWAPMEPYIPESKSNSIVEDIYIPTPKNIEEEKKTDQDRSSPTSTSSESSNSSTSTSSSSQSSEGDKLSRSSVTADATKPSGSSVTADATKPSGSSKTADATKPSGSSKTADATKPSGSLQPSESNNDPCYRTTNKPRTVTGKRKQSLSDKEKSKHKKQKKE
ncbi:serine proteinase stubble-like [Leptopilina heterotoma]|uniref:serine proteinase stubble-like n=1 Tax=Leptopilina heterotoma TaxID=63436 RepID=UPI001CA7D0E8|nr:serine proteinase stubble-like [Leptopilina heterotoma]